MDKEREKEYLEEVLAFIRQSIEDKEIECEDGIERVRELSKYHWDRQSEMDDLEKAYSEYTVNNEAIITNKNLKNLRNLRETLKSPYFGKVTIKFDEDDKESYYVGTNSITKGDEFLVIDWRCPVASLFYNSKLGKTKYKAPNGDIDCDLVERKQIKIKNSKIKRIVDTDVHLDDDELQEVLAKSSGEKMKNIVSTIQEEQNDVIRNLKDKNIIVEGCAGSGKTSVALHRIAYLLYNDHNSRSNNILIFSPSDTFSSYISNVLPELGEENVLGTTFKDFAQSFLTGFKHLESYTEFVSRYYNDENSEEREYLNKFKFSKDFKEAIDAFVIRKSTEYHFTDDITINGAIAPKEYLNKLLDSDSFEGLSLNERIDMLSDVIYKKLPFKEKFLKDNLKNRLTNNLVNYLNPRTIYNEFLDSYEFSTRSGVTDKVKTAKDLEYPDIIGMHYLYFEMMGYPNNDDIHHVVVDEVQDYTPIQLDMIKKLFSGSTFTLLGDSSQTINPYYKYDSLEDMNKYIGMTARYVKLNKAYRSSPEIMEYASNVLDKKIDIIRKSDNVPVKVKDVSKDDLYKELVSDILTLKESGMDRICIITKGDKESRAIYEGLSDKIENLTVLTDDENSKLGKTMVSPAYISKGLEFDAVICYNDLENEFDEKDKYLYYVGVTRAQHSLTIYNEPNKMKEKRR